MDTTELIQSFAEFAQHRDIDRPTMIKILEDVFRALIRKTFDSDENFDIIINLDKGDLQIYRFREIVDDNSEEALEPEYISLTEAQKIEPDFEIGEEVNDEIDISIFGRRLVTTARQTLMQKIRDLEKDRLYNKYIDLVGEMVNVEVHQILSRELLVLDNEGNELVLPKREMIYKDHYRKGQSVRAVVHKVDNDNGNPSIILSRTSPVFLERLFESEVPEIYDGLITIKKVVREPGERAKVSVESYDDRVDPVGACVGVRGSRIHGIVRELQNENIDVISYTDNFDLYVSRALSPAKVSKLVVDSERKRISAYLKPEQVSLAIGKGGHNIKLASRLVGMEIDVFREMEGFEEEDDIAIEEFNDEIDQWIIDEMKKVGLDTAKSVLSLTQDELVRRTDLEDETIEEIINILKAEFE